MEISTIGEFGLIDKITEGTLEKHGSTMKGIGDDAAVLDHNGHKTIVTTDMLMEGIHFNMMYNPLKHLGYKAVVVNVSDIYAMNATPKQITVSLALSSRFTVEDVQELYEGIKAACDYYDVDLVGGDTTSSLQGLAICITAIGVADEKEIVYRSGAKPGDILCVTGDLGAAYLGLQILERERQIFESQPDMGEGFKPDLEEQSYLVKRQLMPDARKDSIEYFRKTKLLPTSMIDISDGLASEVMHICKASGVGAFVEEAKVPISEEAELMALKFKLDPITCALNGGEDYELLFTVKESDLEKIRFMPSVYIIGEITKPEDGIKLHTSGGNIHDLKAQGWVHF